MLFLTRDVAFLFNKIYINMPEVAILVTMTDFFLLRFTPCKAEQSLQGTRDGVTRKRNRKRLRHNS